MTIDEWDEWVKSIKQLWKEIKELVSDYANIPKNNKEPIYYQTKWSLVRDMRKNSQVMNNKPKHLIKKIIR